MALHKTREGWLNEAVELLSDLFAQTKEDGEPVKLPPVRVSCGWPAGNIRKTIGECWPTKSAGDGLSQLFISPKLEEPLEVLATLIHELCHAIDDCENGHKGRFKKLATQMGLEGKMTATHAGEALVEILKPVMQTLGSYPHKKLDLGLSPVKKQTTKMLKASCHKVLDQFDIDTLAHDNELDFDTLEQLQARVGETCGYQLRTTQKWYSLGMPNCPIHETPLEMEEKGETS